MWVFGYGSLMWDGWEKGRQCISINKACLNGYRRRFNKASVKNWGTREAPGPTLNLAEDKEWNCQGIIFEFPDHCRDSILEYLREREGKAFVLEELDVTLEKGNLVTALVPIYRGKNILNDGLVSLVEKTMRARGTSGRSVDYVLGVDEKLKSLGIQDDEVSNMAKSIRKVTNAIDRV